MKKTLLFFSFICILSTLASCRRKPAVPFVAPDFLVNCDLQPTQLLKKSIKDMTFEEAYYAKEYYKHEQDDDMWTKSAQRMIAVGGEQDIIRSAMLELAQYCLDNELYDKAQKYAQDYQLLYPGTNEAKRAGYIEINAHFLSTFDSYRDQSKTEKTVELAQLFFEKYKDDTEYTKSINDIVAICYQKLITRELNVIRSYMSKYNYYKLPAALLSAYKRLVYIKEKYSNYMQHNLEELQELEAEISSHAADLPAVKIIEKSPEENNTKK